MDRCKREKKDIRRMVLTARDALGEEERKRGSLLLTERILGHQWFYGSEDILCFVSYGSEIDTREMIAEALRLGKRVYVPKVILEKKSGEHQAVSAGKRSEAGEGDNRLVRAGKPEDGAAKMAGMEFYRIEDLAQLRQGYKGIMEPAGDTLKYCYAPKRQKSALMIMPGVAFDVFHNRLGYGGGFYDRYLKDRTGLQQRTIGVGFQCQLVEKIPVEDTDVKPCQVICV